jgi:hypothetical protein
VPFVGILLGKIKERGNLGDLNAGGTIFRLVLDK